MNATALPTRDTDAATAADRTIASLRECFGERVATSAALRDQHGHGEAYYASQPPDAVVFPETTQEVAAVVGLCAEHAVPIIAFGAGTSLEGHVTAPRGGICIDLSRMNAIVEVNAEDLDALVEAGVRRRQLEAYLRDLGLFFPIDPGADASLGGMAATRASGTNAVRYGTMKDNVLGLTAVMADGSIIRTGGRARKSSAGYDLTRLLVGSEGTLGIITELRLRLQGTPESITAAVCGFRDLDAAVQTVIETILTGVPIARIELLDALQMKACIAYSKLEGFAPIPTLFFEFHGTDASTQEQAKMVQEIATDHGGSAFRWTANSDERNQLWRARHDVYYAAKAWRPGAMAWASDVCVPISKLAEAIGEAQADIEASGLVAPIVGHVGDGNFHVSFLVDPDDAAEFARAKAVNSRMVDRAIAVGGTCTGEHGVGIGKIDKVAVEQATSLPFWRAIKHALDPKGILNPGKIFTD